MDEERQSREREAEYAGTTTSNLTIHPVQLSDGGEYVVTASSPGGNATAETAMVAIAPPTFSGSPGAGTFTLQFEGPGTHTGFWHNQRLSDLGLHRSYNAGEYMEHSVQWQ